MMDDSQDSQVIQQTTHWINSFIIEYNICPFAKHVVSQDRLNLKLVKPDNIEAALSALMEEIYHLEANPQIETSLLIFPSFVEDFFDYLDLVDLAEKLISEQGYEAVYQLATFHPAYCFAGVSSDDVSNYTNRSPYPMLHLLRESSIDKAIEFYGNTEEIPENNISLMQQLGIKKIKKILAIGL